MTNVPLLIELGSNLRDGLMKIWLHICAGCVLKCKIKLYFAHDFDKPVWTAMDDIELRLFFSGIKAVKTDYDLTNFELNFIFGESSSYFEDHSLFRHMLGNKLLRLVVDWNPQTIILLRRTVFSHEGDFQILN